MGRNELMLKRMEILRAAHKYGAERISLFGSMARGSEGPTSDIDFLVEMAPGRTLFDMGGLNAELESLLGVRVDIVTESGLEPEVRKQVLSEAIAL